MNEQELNLLSRVFFRSCAENAQAWKEIGVRPDDPEDISKAQGFKAWKRANHQASFVGSSYESNMKAMRSAEKYLNRMGYRTTSIRSATPGTVSVRVANAGSVRLCVRVPKEIAERIVILGCIPNLFS
jgi:hypothetical protein